MHPENSFLKDVVVSTTLAGVHFSYYSSDELRRLAVVKVTNAESRDALGNAQPDGIYDVRMGPVDSMASCVTCKLSASDCPGHLGLIELLVPVYNPLTFGDLRALMNAKCFLCNKLRLSSASCALYLELFERLDRGDLEGALNVDPEPPRHVVTFGDLRGNAWLADQADAKADQQMEQQRRQQQQQQEQADADANFIVDDANADVDNADVDPKDANDAETKDRQNLKRKRPAAATTTSGTTPSSTTTTTSSRSINRELLRRTERSNISAINDYRNQLRKRLLRELAASKKCANCNASNPSVTKDPLKTKLFLKMALSSSARNARNKITLPAGFLAVPYQPKAVYQINDKQPEVEYDVIDDDDDDDEDNNNSASKKKQKDVEEEQEEESSDEDDDDEEEVVEEEEDDDNKTVASKAAKSTKIVTNSDNAQYLITSEVRKHLELLWKEEGALLNHVYLGSNSRTVAAAATAPYQLFFLDVSCLMLLNDFEFYFIVYVCF